MWRWVHPGSSLRAKLSWPPKPAAKQHTSPLLSSQVNRRVQGFQAPPSFDQEVAGPPPLARDVEPWLGPGERRPRFEGNHNPHPSVDRHNSNRPSDRPMHQRDDAQPRVENSSLNRSRQLQYEDLDLPAQPQHGAGGHRSGQPQQAPPPRSVFGRLSGAISQGNSLRSQQGDAPQDRNSARPLAERLGQRMDSESGRNGPDLRGSRQDLRSEQAGGRRTIAWGERGGGARVNGWGDVERRVESGRREETQVGAQLHDRKGVMTCNRSPVRFRCFQNEV